MPSVILDWDEKKNKGVISSDFLKNIRAKISVPNEAATRFYNGYNRFASEFISPITNSGYFEIGLYFEILKIIQNDPIQYDVTTTKLLSDKIIQAYPWSQQCEIETLSLPLRDYQEDSVRQSIKFGYGVNVVATAGGKTLIMSSLIQTIRKNQDKPFTTLVILPSNLLSQTYTEFVNYGIPANQISKWGGDSDYEKKPIIIVGAEILKRALITCSDLSPKNVMEWEKVKNKKENTYNEYVVAFTQKEKARKKEWINRKKQILDELNDIDLILIDEVHGLRHKNVITNALNLFPTRHRFGFTGTLPKDLIDQWNIIGNIGPIITNVDSANLRSKNYISQVSVVGTVIHYKKPPIYKADPEAPMDPTGAYLEECDFLYNNEYRNSVINQMASKLDKNMLILVNKLDHGEKLKEVLAANTNKKVFFVRGSVDIEDRESLRQLMEVEDNIVCIAMDRIFATGINIKNLHYVIFAQGGKAKVTLIQSIGRGLRLHKDKQKLIIIDIADNTRYGKKHLSERMKYYKSEQIGFEFTDIYEK